MKFETLQKRVQRAERLVELRAEQSLHQWETLKRTWRAGWTPGRIIAAGLAAGFLVGRANPTRALSGARWMQLLGSISGLFASVQATTAAEHADEAVDTADHVQARAGEQAAPPASSEEWEEPVVDEAYDEEEVVAPRPAEAATEVSER